MKLAVASFALTACVAFDDPVEPTATTTTPLYGCPLLICGENAATTGDGLLFDELDLFGRANYAGVSMVGANLASGAPAKIDIVGDRLYAYDNWGVRYDGYALLGMQIHFKHTSGEKFNIRLDGFDDKSVRYRSGANEAIPVYEFKADSAGDKQFGFEICNSDSMPERTWDGLDHYALLYRGDRYDHTTKSLMDNDPSDGWSFLACNGSAATKLQLWRHTYAGGFDDSHTPRFMTSLDDRTALLKAITADYCGLGSPQFTVTGTPLVFATAAEPLDFPSPATLGEIDFIEAEWKASGATCLDIPRLQAAGITREYVEDACGHPFPKCPATLDATGAPLGWASASHAVTARWTPPPP